MALRDDLEELRLGFAELQSDLSALNTRLLEIRANADTLSAKLVALQSPPTPGKWQLMLYPLDVTWPVSGEFGVMYNIGGIVWQHEGIDFACPAGCGVMACASGTVKFAGVKGGYGNFMQIEHRDGRRTGYAHLSVIDCFVGKTVIARQRIGVSGDTGNVDGAHLHVTVWSPYSTFKPIGCGEYLRSVENPREHIAIP